jgi:ZIP family zinc transporter
MTAVAFTLVTFFSTLTGGLFALRFRDHLHLLLGLSAGVLIGVAFLDALPEALELGHTAGVPMTLILLMALAGFLFFHVLEKGIVLHARRGEESDDVEHAHLGTLGAGSFAFHSFLDGAAIGVGFQASAQVGLLIALAVLAHDFSDGFNTVTVLLRHSGSMRSSFKWLLVDAPTPLLGAASTLLLGIPEAWLAFLLAEFAGSFLYIGASDLLPEAHHRHGSARTMVLTLTGVVFVFALMQTVKS